MDKSSVVQTHRPVLRPGGESERAVLRRKPASETPWTKKLWIYNLRTNMHFTLKTDPLKREDLDEFVKCYNPENRHNRKPTWSENLDSGAAAGMTAKGKKKGADSVHPSTGSGRTGLDDSGRAGSDGRWRAYTYDELISRDKASLDIFWLKDESMSDSDNLPEPGVIALEIVQDLEAALEQFRQIAVDFGSADAEEVA